MIGQEEMKFTMRDELITELKAFLNDEIDISNSQETEATSPDTRMFDLSELKVACPNMDEISSNEDLFVSQESSSFSDSSKKATFVNKKTGFKLTDCLKINWRKKIENLREASKNKLISRLNFLQNNKINFFNLKCLLEGEGQVASNVRVKNNNFKKKKTKNRKSKANAVNKQAKVDMNVHMPSRISSPKHKDVHNIFVPKGDFFNIVGIDYNELTPDIFNKTDMTADDRQNFVCPGGFQLK